MTILVRINFALVAALAIAGPRSFQAAGVGEGTTGGFTPDDWSLARSQWVLSVAGAEQNASQWNLAWTDVTARW